MQTDARHISSRITIGPVWLAVFGSEGVAHLCGAKYLK